MICIDAENLQDGLYNIKDGKIFKYKAKGGTVRTYELRNIVTCGECKHENSCEHQVLLSTMWNEVEDTADIEYCSYGERRE